MRVEADSLQEAFSKAASELTCSVTELSIEVIQHPRSGLFGMFKKIAIIEAYKEGTHKRAKHKHEKHPHKQNHSTKAQKHEHGKGTSPHTKAPKADINRVLPDIKKGIHSLVENSCFDINIINIKAYNDETVLIELDGEDSALLIGKEGYRYKAFSYLLYNWINIKYSLGIRLEIAEFLQNQETMIDKYLTNVITKIQNNGRGQTKPLDGVLIKIALERLRAKFPDKYVGIKTGREGAKFIVVNDFNRKQS